MNTSFILVDEIGMYVLGPIMEVVGIWTTLER